MNEHIFALKGLSKPPEMLFGIVCGLAAWGVMITLARSLLI